MSKEKKQKLKNIRKITLKLIRLDFLWYVFNHDLIVYAMIQLYIIKSSTFMVYKQTDRDGILMPG